MEEYIVILKSKEDLASFYDDMETAGGPLHIPDRSVDCSLRRPISRNTVYLLTDEEASQIYNDERVQSIRKKIEPTIQLSSFDRTGRFDKSLNLTPDYSNSTSWSLLRTRLRYNDNPSLINNWIPQFPNNGSGSDLYIDDTITVTESGENVDIIIIDYGSVLPTHPEFAENLNGTGGSRVQEINWNIYTSEVQGDNPGLNASTNYLIQDYSYTPYSTGNATTDKEINHGCACASLAAGNTNGAAFKANIYNISTFTNWLRLNGNVASNGSLFFTLWDYIRAFHNNKAVNPNTGIKNPTIVSASYAYIYNMNQNNNTWPHYARHNGLNYGDINNTSVKLTASQMEQAEILAQYNIEGSSPNLTATITYAIDDIIADIQDAIADGIHVVSSAGNFNMVMEPIGTSKYNSTYLRTGDIGAVNYNYKNKGLLPNDGILVGALSGTREGVGVSATGKGEMPDYYTNRGAGVDVYAPAAGCVAAVNADTGDERQDPRNSSFYFGYFGGTSAACPNVAGILACVLERFPNYTPAQLKEYLLANMSADEEDNEIGDDGRAWPGRQPSPLGGGGGIYDNFSFHPEETPRAAAFVRNIRPAEGRCETKEIYGARKNSGKVYPRSKICRTYR